MDKEQQGVQEKAASNSSKQPGMQPVEDESFDCRLEHTNLWRWFLCVMSFDCLYSANKVFLSVELTVPLVPVVRSDVRLF